MDFAFWHLAGEFHLAQTLGYVFLPEYYWLNSEVFAALQKTERRKFMTKKKKTETKLENRISFRLTDQQYENLLVVAKRCRITPSEYIRHCLGTDEMIVIEIFEVKSEELEKITENYSALGEIFNQLARYLNAGGEKTKQIEDEIHETIYRLLDLNSMWSASS